MKLSAHQLGCQKELEARAYLTKQGLRLETANYRCKVGEIDLIMRDQNDVLVFIEVRHRAKENYGSGADSITRSKINRIIRAAKCYLQERDLYNTAACRFDVVSSSIEKNSISQSNNWTWIKDAFSARAW
jgi:putative endonuclease